MVERMQMLFFQDKKKKKIRDEKFIIVGQWI